MSAGKKQKNRWPPVTWLALGMLGAFVLIGLVMTLAARQPWLGLQLSWDDERQAARVVASQGPGGLVPAGTQVAGLTAGLAGERREWVFEAIDFTIEPDGNLPTYDDYRLFLKRQGELSAIQRAPLITLAAGNGEQYAITPAPTRPFSTLPPDFWVQLVTGFVAWMISVGVWAFRRDDASARYLMLSGLAIMLSAYGASVYTTRELAVPLGQLLLLKTMNFGGGLTYCAIMAALLWHYPRRLGPAWVSAAIVAASLAWFGAQALGAFDSMITGRRVPVFVALAAILVFSVLQWLRTRKDPVARAALQWFLLAWLVGISVFSILIFVPQLYDVNTAAIQGYSFSLFLLVYVGLAFGILRFRLFELGEWWFRTLTWILGAVMLVALDLLLLLGLQLSYTLSLTLSLVICGFLWLPMRSWLWLKLMTRHEGKPQALFKDVLHVALGPSPEERRQRWGELLKRLYAPLQTTALRESQSRAPAIEANGLALLLPATTESPALRLEYPGGGRRLFNRQDATQAAELLDMLEHANQNRDAYNRGVREERSRIARDLHDDIGSCLLSALHQPDLQQSKAAVSQGMMEIQTIVRGLSGQQMPLDVVLGELRHETGLRLETAGIAMHWPWRDEAGDEQLGYRSYRNYLSIMRELVANTIKHAQATRLSISVQCQDGVLATELENDGRSFDGAPGPTGRGLHNLHSRAAELGGSLAYEALPSGTRVRLRIPLHNINAASLAPFT